VTETAAPSGTGVLLLVEDNPTDAELTIKVLKQYHFAETIVWIKDGADALDYLYRRGAHAGIDPTARPKVVLLDLRLPKVDGIEVLRAVKEDDALKSIPVVVLTSSHEDRDLVDSYRLGVNSYIQKPVVFEEFAKQIANVGLYWLLSNKVPE
jgi:CheY-like chemotaxis protein